MAITQEKAAVLMQKDVLDRRMKDPKRLSKADEMLESIEIVGTPFADGLGVKGALNIFRSAVALYGSKIKGIKQIVFNGIALRSDLEQGILNVNADASNMYQEVGRFLALNDPAYTEAIKYFATSDLEQQFSTYYAEMETGERALNLALEFPERFKFMMGVIDDKPKNTKVWTKTPSTIEQTTELPKTG